MYKISAIALNTFKEAVRNRILYSILFFGVILVVVSSLFGSVSIGQQEKVIKDFGLFSLSFLGAIISILSGVNLLNKELKQKTIYNILSKPVSRFQFVIGKYIGLTLTISLLTFLMGLALFVFVWQIEGNPDFLLFQGVFLIILELSMVSAITIFFSSLVVTLTLSGIFTLAFYLAGRSISYLKYFLNQDSATPPILLSLISVFDWIVPDLSLFNVSDAIVYGQAVSVEYLINACCYAFSYNLICLILAGVIFSKRELV